MVHSFFSINFLKVLISNLSQTLFFPAEFALDNIFINISEFLAASNMAVALLYSYSSCLMFV